jgi:hypothetical protein
LRKPEEAEGDLRIVHWHSGLAEQFDVLKVLLASGSALVPDQIAPPEERKDQDLQEAGRPCEAAGSPTEWQIRVALTPPIGAACR